VVHEYGRFVRDELESRGWRQSELAARSGLSRQLISSILNDTRDHLGQMPDTATLEGLAAGFDIPATRIRHAAARSLVGYTTNDDAPLRLDLRDVPLDALINEIRHRAQGE